MDGALRDMARAGRPADEDGDGPGDVGRALDELTAAYDDDRVRRVIDALIHPSPASARRPAAPAAHEPPAAAAESDSRSTAALHLNGLCRADTWRRLLEVEHACAARYDAKTTVIELEITDIAVIETVLGEAAASRLVRVLADTLREDTRTADTFARISRWRIAGILPHTDGRTADAVVRRISDGFGRRLGGALPVRLAVGRAELDPSLGVDATLARAEGALTGDPRSAVAGGRGSERMDPPPDAAPSGRAGAGDAGGTLSDLDGRHPRDGLGGGRRRADTPVPDRLRELERLRADGLVSDEEYRRGRRRILRRV